MSAIVTNRTRIQNALVNAAMARAFYAVTYPNNVATVASNTVIPPASALCNEIQSLFRIDKDYGRREIERRTAWSFSLQLKFNQEVTLEPFEEYLLDSPIILQRDVANNLKQVRIFLTRTVVVHPTQQQPAGGTMATMTFDAIEHRS
jgi:hypothetical protein